MKLGKDIQTDSLIEVMEGMETTYQQAAPLFEFELDLTKDEGSWADLTDSLIQIYSDLGIEREYSSVVTLNLTKVLQGADYQVLPPEYPMNTFPYEKRNAPPSAMEVSRQAGNKLILFPNPTHGVFTVTGILDSDKGRIEIIEGASGRVVYSQAVDSDREFRMEISLPQLPSGIFNVSLWEKGNFVEAKKLVLIRH